jgi:tetratricopeptide (TPR) repeat protein
MFRSSAWTKLKSAETAIEDGRLDEAVEIMAEPEVRQHRHAAPVLARLAAALLDRVREYEKSGQYAEALLALNQAAAAGASPEEIASLREWIQGLAARDHRHQDNRRRQVEAARDRIDAGSLQGGMDVLDGLDARDSEVQALRRDVETRERGAERLVSEAQEFVRIGQLGSACRSIQQAKAMDSKDVAVVRVEADVTRVVVAQCREALAAGRVETASDLLLQLGDVGATSTERADCQRLLDEVRTARAAVARSDWATARRATLRLKSQLPDSQWIIDAATQLDQVEELVTAIHAGPLGVVPGEPGGGVGSPAPDARKVRVDRAEPTFRLSRHDVTRPIAPPVVGPSAPRRTRLLVDGAGSFLLLSQDRVSIGRAGSGAVADLAFLADLSTHHANIARVDEDYFLFAQRPVRVNRREVKQRLLEDGDRIELSRRVRMTFRKPSRASASAVLDLGGSLRLEGDVRRVVLFDRHATLGPGAGNHVVVPKADGVVALFERAGTLMARVTSGAAGSGGRSSDAVPLSSDAPIEIAGVRMIAKKE